MLLFITYFFYFAILQFLLFLSSAFIPLSVPFFPPLSFLLFSSFLSIALLFSSLLFYYFKKKTFFFSLSTTVPFPSLLSSLSHLTFSIFFSAFLSVKNKIYMFKQTKWFGIVWKSSHVQTCWGNKSFIFLVWYLSLWILKRGRRVEGKRGREIDFYGFFIQLLSLSVLTKTIIKGST